MKPFLSVIIPVRNEAGELPLALIDMDRELSRADYSYEILVVNDGSDDGTAGVVEKFSRLVKNLKSIDSRENHGKGWAVRRGMLEARGNYRLFTDAYNSVSVDNFGKMLPYFKEGYGVVAGSRKNQGFWSALENLLARFLARSEVRDVRPGFMCFTEETAAAIFGSLATDRWGFEAEIPLLAKSLGYRMKEISVDWVSHPHSVLGPGPYLSMLLDISRFRRRMKRRDDLAER